MNLNGIRIPKELIFPMSCGKKVIYFDFEDPQYKTIAQELIKFKYSIRLERRVQNKQTGQIINLSPEISGIFVWLAVAKVMTH